ncbi:MAG: ABC transporter substrate-binding protein [Planctomycetota bacterium]|jgi:branched-chain amino acid transport system substrate-binding protein|nr:ABC transporter substrate-binding protein [Planctomycetota bacterium]
MLPPTTDTTQRTAINGIGRAFLTCALALAAAAPLAAEVGVTDAEILIGQSAALTGPAAKLGLGMQAGLQAAFAEANAAGGVHGRQLKLVSRDDGYEPDRAIESTLGLIEEDEVFMLSGYVGTPTAKAAVPIITDMEVPLVGLFTGAGFLRDPVKADVFNVRASYDQEIEALVERLTKDLGAAKIGVFYQDDGFGMVGLNGTKKALDKRSMALAGTGTYPRNTEAVKAGMTQLLKGEPDAVVMVGAYKPLAAFIREVRAQGFTGPLATISFTGTEALIVELGDAANGLVISQVVPSPLAEDIAIIKRFRAAIPEDQVTFMSLEGYITGVIVVEALKAAGPDLDRAALRAALNAMAIDLGGLKVAFAADDHQAFEDVHITQIRDGVAKPVTVVTP